MDLNSSSDDEHIILCRKRLVPPEGNGAAPLWPPVKRVANITQDTEGTSMFSERVSDKMKHYTQQPTPPEGLLAILSVHMITCGQGQ